VHIAPYQADWPRQFDRLAQDLSTVLRPLAIRVDHIGSTSIPGMHAKDVIDVQVSVADLAAAAAAFDEPLARLGFERGPYESDHVPAGHDDAPAPWAKRFWSRRGHPDGDVNLHVRRSGSPGERFALLFRDWLRANPHAVIAYSRFKTALAASMPGLDRYTDVKDPVVDIVVIAAEQWATTARWQPVATEVSEQR
jgi:GrpB-like predicted nucleotidyltransferase (UPF0157 family)